MQAGGKVRVGDLAKMKSGEKRWGVTVVFLVVAHELAFN